MFYAISLRLDYSYDAPADASRQILRILPQSEPERQRVDGARVEITPEPDQRREGTDFFGNRVLLTTFRRPHRDIVFRLSAQVACHGPDRLLGEDVETAALGEQLERDVSLGPVSPHHFLAASPRVPFDPAIAAFASSVADRHAGSLATVEAVGRAVNEAMRFDSKATTVTTLPGEAFAARRGVCQDFTHVMIAALRSLGIPAGYVSGLLRTIPPAGEARLEGADAMHAWVMAWCGRDQGWVEFDPTNAIGIGVDHIVVARGRDYADIAPVRGSLRTAGTQESRQAVDVIPLSKEIGA